ncbi:MAG: hypothetical protein HKP30_06655, partial [Myxococcales bacterium]|nr:hypothetical protein [Myxococcales bacterium]
RVAEGGAALARTAQRIEDQSFAEPMVLNNYAWLIATSHRTDAEALDVALRLARRAVAETGREDPNVLDTLAEVQFVAGDSEAAVDTIEEAIALSPDEPYFQEQRRRFLGERAADDRPEPPEEDALPEPGRRGPREDPSDGVTA